MISNVIMTSADRNLFGVIIKQNTKHGQSLSVTDLMKAYETARFQYGWSDRKIDHIINTKDFKERVYYILKKRGLVKTEISDFMNFIENQSLSII